MKRLVMCVCGALTIISLMACGGQENTSGQENVEKTDSVADQLENQQDTIVLKVAYDSAETTPVGIGLYQFAELVSERTDGEVQIDVNANGTLGSASDYIVNCQLGTLDIGTMNQSILSSFVEDIAAIDIPYIIESYEHADNVFLGEVGDYYSQEILDSLGVRVIGIWEIGFRNLTNSKHPVNQVDDVKGLRIRTMDNKVHQDFWKTLGADPVPMSWNEAYTAMQQGAIDGQENPLSIILGNKVAEVNHHLAITEHVYSSQFVCISDKAWKSLNEEQQQIILDCCAEAGIGEREEQRRQAEESVKELENAGMEVTYPDKQGFIDMSKDFRESAAQEYAEVIQMISEAR